MLLTRLSLYSMAAVFMGFGLLFLVHPSSLTSMVEVAMPTPVAMMEIRGVYGGFFLGTGLLFLILVFRDRWLRPGLIAQASIMGGLALGRAAGLVLDGTPNTFIAVLFGAEIFGLTIALILLGLLDGEAA